MEGLDGEEVLLQCKPKQLDSSRVDLFRKYFERRGTNGPIVRWLAWLNIHSGGKPQ